jgi:ribokinase
MLALGSPELRVELITTVAGNVPVEIGTENARRILELVNPSTRPVLAQGAARPLQRSLHTATSGFHGDDGLGGLTRLRRANGTLLYPAPRWPVLRRLAVQQLLKLVQTYGKDLTIIALGPLTNIARAIQQAPNIMQHLGRLIIMGGAIRVPGNVSPSAEFNIFVDPHAADIVFTAGLPTLLVPLDVTQQVRLTWDFLQRTTSGAGTRLAQATRQMTRQLLNGPPNGPPNGSPKGPRQAGGMAMHDPLAVAVALEPSLVRLEALPLRAETRGQHTMGMTVADWSPPDRRSPSTPLIEVALAVDASRTLELFAKRVLAPQSSRPGTTKPPASVIVVGSANTDLTVRAPHLPKEGETVLGTELHTTFGGKGANQAVAAKRAGARVYFLTKLGQDSYGQDYARYLRQQGVDISGMRRDPVNPSGVALITVDRRGQNQITVASGANATFAPGDLDRLEELLPQGRVLLVQLEIPLETVETALRRAKAAGLMTILNPAPAQQLPGRLVRLIDILVPNEVEARTLCGHPAGTPRQARNAARLLRRAGYRTVIITLGKQGVLYLGEHSTAYLPGLAVEAKDATAAGDTFVGYLACALAEGKAFPEAIGLANAAAALAVTRAGAQPSIPSQREVRQFLAARKE